MAATASKRAASPQTAVALFNDIFGKDGFLERHCIERREEIKLLGISTLSGVDTLLLGPPGVAKTWMISLLTNHCFGEDIKLFTHLLAKDMSSDEVLGPQSLNARKEDKIRRVTEGFLPEAHYGYLDEVFKASPPLLNPLLDLTADRILKEGAQVKGCKQLISIFMSSNELPDREDLSAFRDRIGITKVVLPVRTDEGRRSVTDVQLSFQSRGITDAPEDKLSLELIEQMREEIHDIDVPDHIREIMVEAQKRWADKMSGGPSQAGGPSQRRIGQMWRAIKACAWMHGATEVTVNDLMVCEHMAWSNLDERDAAREVIVEFASAFMRKIENLRTTFEPISRKIEEMKEEMKGAPDEEKDRIMSEGLTFTRSVRKLHKDAQALKKDGEANNESVEPLDEIIQELADKREWMRNVMSGDDDADE